MDHHEINERKDQIQILKKGIGEKFVVQYVKGVYQELHRLFTDADIIKYIKLSKIWVGR